MILDFNKINKEDILLVGGKGANLGELMFIGANVPNGFVLSTQAYENFIRENGIEDFIIEELSKAKDDEEKKLKLGNIFRNKILKAKFPEKIEIAIKEKYYKMGENLSLAIRSSATAEDLDENSFAGQQETYLNVRDISDVFDKIRACYASLWSDRAISYRLNENYEQKNLSIAVVVQQMVESEKSGVIFTTNPLNNSSNELYIDASFGLGESVVSGQVNADNYIISKSGEILSVNIGDKKIQIVYSDKGTKSIAIEEAKSLSRVLSDEEIRDLLEIAIKIEEHYSCPMDIEWGIKDNKIYILQARKITTINKNSYEESILPYIKDVKIKKYNKYLMSFLIEKIPFNFKPIEFDYFTEITSQKAKIFSENGIGLSPNLIMDDAGIMTISREKISLNFNIFKIFGTVKNLRNFTYCANMCEDFLEEYNDKINFFRDLDFENMDLDACRNFILYSFKLIGDIGYFRFKYAVFPTILNRSLKRVIEKVNKTYTVFDLYWGLNNKTSVVENDILKIAEFIKENKVLNQAVLSGISYDELIERFPYFKGLANDFFDRNGFMSDYISYCVKGRSFNEKPNRLLELLRPILKEEKNIHKSNDSSKFDKIKESLKKIYGNKYPSIEEKINNFRYFHFVREESQYFSGIIFFFLRKCLKRINILLLDDDNYERGIANLFHKELIEVLNRGYLSEDDKDKIVKRNQNRDLATRVWNASKLLIYENKGNVLKGISGSSGIAVAKVCVVKSPDEFYKLKQGDILVCPFTAPDWTALFSIASAVVADTGSALSHAAIVAREFGIPAVLGLGFACERLKDGDIIRVDGDKGEISIITKK